jgi:hypothetical protein
MAIVITNAGKQKALEYFVGKDTATESLILKLYSNNISPERDDTLDLYTEVTDGGYVSKALTPASWSITDGTAEYPQQVWTFTGTASSVYGYYAVSATSNELMFAERFASGPYTITTSGDIIRVTLNLSLI